MIYKAFWLFGMTVGYPVQLLFFRRKVYFEDKSHTDFLNKGALIVSNHFNMLDYVHTAFIVFPRRLNVVASESPFKNPFFRFGMKFFGAIQANRETKNMRFMDISAETIKNGKLVQIFPEGRNTPDGNMHEFKKSYIVIAHRAKSSIIPIVSDGEYGLFKRASFIVGKEIDLTPFITSDKTTPPRDELDRANDYVYGRMLELRSELEKRKADGARRK